jgi:hypothetical protein
MSCCIPCPPAEQKFDATGGGGEKLPGVHGDTHNGLRLDPLTDLDVQRALALARAREGYPGLPREELLEYCEAAWEVALRADPNRTNLLGTFDRALLTIAWTRRRSGGRVPLRELVAQTIPRAALEPFIASPGDMAGEEEREPALGAQPAEAPVAWRSLLRVPFTSPIPVGAAVAAGVVGLALVNEARVLPVAAPRLAGNDDAKAPPGGSAPSMGERAEPAPASPLASTGSGLLSSGLVADELDEAGIQAQQAAVARRGDQAAAIEASRAPAEQAPQRLAAAVPADAAEPTSIAGAPGPAPSARPAPRPVVRLQLPEPAILVEVDLPRGGDDEPDDAPETGEPPHDGGSEGNHGGDEYGADSEEGRGPDGDDEARSPDPVTLEEVLEQIAAGEDVEPPAGGDGEPGPDGLDPAPVEDGPPASPPAPAPPVETTPSPPPPEAPPTSVTAPASPAPAGPEASDAPEADAPDRAPAAPASDAADEAPAAPASDAPEAAPAAPASDAPEVAPAAPASDAPEASAPAPAAPTAPAPRPSGSDAPAPPAHPA